MDDVDIRAEALRQAMIVFQTVPSINVVDVATQFYGFLVNAIPTEKKE